MNKFEYSNNLYKLTLLNCWVKSKYYEKKHNTIDSNINM